MIPLPTPQNRCNQHYLGGTRTSAAAPYEEFMIIEHIFTCPPGNESQVEHQSVQLAGAGIEGDRYYGAQDKPGQNITFVEAKEIEAFAAAVPLHLLLH